MITYWPMSRKFEDDWFSDDSLGAELYYLLLPGLNSNGSGFWWYVKEARGILLEGMPKEER